MSTVGDKIRERGHGRVRTLVIGAGVAGLTLAALLRQRGEQPHIVERAGSNDEAGYNIALYPIGSRVLHGLGLFDRLLDTSRPARYYELGNGKGEVLHRFDFDAVLAQYGPLVGLKRAELLAVLRPALGDLPIHVGTTVTAIQPEQDEVRVTFSDGSQASFDLVVGADGMHSTTRSMVLGPEEFAYWDTGWGCWVTWADEAIVPPETMAEFWGAGFLVGIYPVKGAQGVVIAGPKKKLKEDGRIAFAEHVRHHLRDFGGPVPAVLDALEKDPRPFFWDLHDCRCRRWAVGRVVLLGDAAAGFLPTAGVGASMAMMSAAALADELSRADAAHIEYALRLFVSRARPKVEAAQDNSRHLAKLMMVESLPLAWGREQLLRFYTLDQALRDIMRVMEGTI